MTGPLFWGTMKRLLLLTLLLLPLSAQAERRDCFKPKREWAYWWLYPAKYIQLGEMERQQFLFVKCTAGTPIGLTRFEVAPICVGDRIIGINIEGGIYWSCRVTKIQR